MGRRQRLARRDQDGRAEAAALAVQATDGVPLPIVRLDDDTIVGGRRRDRLDPVGSSIGTEAEHQDEDSKDDTVQSRPPSTISHLSHEWPGG